MTRQTKILFVATSFPRFTNDSCGSFIYRIAKSLAETIHVEVLAPSYPSAPPQEKVADIEIHRVTYFIPQSAQRLCYVNGGILANIRNSWLARLQVPLLLSSMTWRLFQLCPKFDLIHCHWLPMVWVAWLGSRLRFMRVPIVFTNWGSDTRLLPRWLIKLTLKVTTGCISTAAETDVHLLECGRAQFARIPAPVDESRFNASLGKETSRQYLGIPSKIQFVFCFAGRLNYFKDPLTFIRACATLKERGASFIALLAGDGDLKAECSCSIEKLSLQNCVRLLGDRQDVEYLYRAADVAVHISPIENTWANTIAEAMFCETPIIITDVGHTRTTFTNGLDCIIIPACDPMALADKLMLVAQDKLLARKLTEGADALIKKYGKDTASIRARILDYYASLLK
jgi:phosphatidyl-myo-inositol dimannoside synthase